MTDEEKAKDYKRVEEEFDIVYRLGRDKKEFSLRSAMMNVDNLLSQARQEGRESMTLELMDEWKFCSGIAEGKKLGYEACRKDAVEVAEIASKARETTESTKECKRYIVCSCGTFIAKAIKEMKPKEDSRD